jgi:hypothetical protein
MAVHLPAIHRSRMLTEAIQRRNVFALLIAHQLYRYTFTQAPWLLAITVLDILISGSHGRNFAISVP